MAVVPTPNSAGFLLNLSMSQESKDLRWFSKLLNDKVLDNTWRSLHTTAPSENHLAHSHIRALSLAVKTAIEFALKQFPELILLRNPLSV